MFLSSWDVTLETLQGHGARQRANASKLLPAESFRHLLHKRANRTASPSEDQVVGVRTSGKLGDMGYEIKSEQHMMFHTENKCDFSGNLSNFL